VKPSVLVTKRIFPEAVELLRRHADVDYVDSDDGLPPDQLIARSRGRQAIVSQLTDKFGPERLDQLDGVRVIANVAVGYDNVDIPAATRKRILVTNTPDVLTDTTADLAFALLLAAARRIVEGHQFVLSGTWRKWAIDLMAARYLRNGTHRPGHGAPRPWFLDARALLR
jgi:lactate dehydrogenase-like 2-hydroxyacid dehydrogenase